jgi:acyl-CoA synthetase (AMP-forming)/AMP-acid ligase II
MTIIDVLRERAGSKGDQKAFAFLKNGEDESDSVNFRQLDRRAREIAGMLQELGGKPGDRVLMIYTPGIAFIEAFYGCLYAGMIAVPVKPPSRRQPLDHVQLVLQDCDPEFILTDRVSIQDLGPRIIEHLTIRHVRVLVTDEIPQGGARDGDDGWTALNRSSGSLAVLQYTSGSTGSPKGVRITHGNIMANMQMIKDAFGNNGNTVGVGWLPLFHDMGLVGNILQPVYAGCLGVLMPPMAFLQKPMRWLKAISTYRGTCCGGPNFAYELCCTRFRPEELVGVDLSSWQVAFNGSEPVRNTTLKKFSSIFSDYGFRHTAHHPCYGMAEATLMVTAGYINETPRVITRNMPGMPPGTEMEFVRCGHNLPGQELKIVDADNGTLCGDKAIGEIWIKGPHVSGGYWNKEEFNKEAFDKAIGEARSGGFFKTGDLGFLNGEELYICGRVKEMIIIRGRNLFPYDIERRAEEAHPALVPHGSVAIGLEDGPETRLILIMEVKRAFRASIVYDDCLQTLREAISSSMDIFLYDLVLIDEMTIPKTFSGKPRRAFCKQEYVAGRFRVFDATPGL